MLKVVWKTLFMERQVKTDRDRFICISPLLKDGFDNTIYRWLKELEFSKIRPKILILGTFESNEIEELTPSTSIDQSEYCGSCHFL